ncbi:MAG: NADH-quinone oxidoreductase subunit C [Rhodospirillaceae bacterium]|nr:MAG: NADH-quinone oxidoreductase subunit C [Rhodospirillaceae bacterium]
MDEALKELSDMIQAALPDQVIETQIAHGELMIVVPAQSIVKILGFLRDNANCQFSILVDVCGVDYPEREKRFEVVYNLLSLEQNQRIRVKASVGEDETIPSVVGVYSAANWWEREAWDLYGIFFSEHPDLRRILTDYGFEGHPLRKDFPLTGFVELRYDEAQKRVVYEPVKLTQEFRSFDFMSPWEGTEILLPGDEKADGQEGGKRS